MRATGFDAHETVRRLTEAGASEPLAEAIVSAIGDVGERAASKAGMAADGVCHRADPGSLKAELAAFETRFTACLYRALWLHGAGVVAGIAAVKFFLPLA